MVTAIAAWMLDPVVCASMATIGAPCVSISALLDLHHLLIERGFRRSSRGDPNIVQELGLKCPEDGSPLGPPRRFNLMFKTFMGPVEEQAAVIYMRPETAQGIYVNYLNVLQSSRQKIPFGIAQVGKAFRNEITPGNFIFRTREFEQMEMQFFVKPGSENEWFEFWRAERMNWIKGLGIRDEKLRWHQHGKDELAHYAKDA